MSNAEMPLPRTVVPEGITDPVLSARAELKAALAAIEQKGNLPRRAENAIGRANVRVRRFAQTNPAATVAGGIGAALAVGAAVWAIARMLSR